MSLFKTTYKNRRTGKTEKSQKYYLDFADARHIRRRIPAFEYKAPSEQLEENIKKLVAYRQGKKTASLSMDWIEALPPRITDKLVEIGLLDTDIAAAVKPLKKHVEDFKRSLLAKDRPANYANNKVTRINSIIDGCRYRTWSDIENNPDRIEQYLKSRREGPGGISVQTSNHYLQAVKQFAAWMFDNKRASKPLPRRLKPLEVKNEKIHSRRSLEIDEFMRLLEATIKAPKRFGMTGYERYLLYRLASQTGLRAKELRSLKVSSFDFKNKTVFVSGKYTKNKNDALQPLTAETAKELQEFFQSMNKLPDAKAFGGTRKQLTKRTSDMLRSDLGETVIKDEHGEIIQEAIPYVDDAGRFCDFHSMRHTAGSFLAASGVHPKVAQKLMRHSDINLTMSLYTHILRGQEAEAIARLPDFHFPDSQKNLKTGTDDIEVDSCLCASLCAQSESDQNNTVRNEQLGNNVTHLSQIAESTLMESKSPISGEKRRGRDSNPGSGCIPAGRFSKPLP
jgi:integrase